MFHLIFGWDTPARCVQYTPVCATGACVDLGRLARAETSAGCPRDHGDSSPWRSELCEAKRIHYLLLGRRISRRDHLCLCAAKLWRKCRSLIGCLSGRGVEDAVKLAACCHAVPGHLSNLETDHMWVGRNHGQKLILIVPTGGMD